MTTRGVRAGRDPDFTRAVAGLTDAPVRPEVHLTEIPAPQRVAPHAVALSAEVHSTLRGAAEDDEPVATGRFVVLHDPAAPAAWSGTWRVVTFLRARLEAELAADPLLGEVGWSWLTEGLTAGAVAHGALGGTATTVVSAGFGSLADQEPSVELEVRASWTPVGDDLAAQLATWADVLCTVAGLPPMPDGVRPLRARRA